MNRTNNNKNNSNITDSFDPIDFFYSHLEEVSLFGVTADESETIIVTRRDSPEATITTSDSTVFTKIRKNILADPEHKERNVRQDIHAGADRDPLHFIEIIVTCPKKLVSLRSKTATREMTEEQKEAMRERMSKMWKNRGEDADGDEDED